MRIVPVNCITKETVLAKTLYNSNGNVLLRKGSTITKTLLEKIKAADVNTIYIDDGYSDIEIEEVVKPELRHSAVKTIKDTFTHIENDLKKNLENSQNLNSRLQSKVMGKYVENLKNTADAIIEDIMKSHHLMVNVVDIKHIGDYMYEHSVNVAILSLIIGIELRFSRHELYTLFVGAILHDLGKVFVEEDILNQGDDLTEEELDVYESHTIQGFDYVKENQGFSITSKLVIIQHHEHYDGNGYPYGVKEDGIHKNSKIVAICNTYDKMTSDSPNSPALPANEAIEYIMGNAGSKFDFDMVSTFVRKINPYPPGTLVDLSNHTTAVIVDSNVDYPLRPIVQVLELVDGKAVKKELYNLIEVTDITITKIRYLDVGMNDSDEGIIENDEDK